MKLVAWFLFLLVVVTFTREPNISNATPVPEFFRKYKNLGKSAEGNFFSLMPSRDLVDGKYPCYFYRYNFDSQKHEGLMYAMAWKIYIRKKKFETEGDDELLFDLSPGIIGKVVRNEDPENGYSEVILEDIFSKDYLGDTVYKFRTRFRNKRTDIVHLVSREHGIIALYSCYHYSSYSCSKDDELEHDEILRFVGYGGFSDLNPNMSRYE